MLNSLIFFKDLFDIHTEIMSVIFLFRIPQNCISLILRNIFFTIDSFGISSVYFLGCNKINFRAHDFNITQQN
jgi:hypothetical protein